MILWPNCPASSNAWGRRHRCLDPSFPPFEVTLHALCSYQSHNFSFDSVTSLKDLKGFSFHICHLRIPRATQDIRHHLRGEGLRLRESDHCPGLTAELLTPQPVLWASLPLRAFRGTLLPRNLKLHFIKQAPWSHTIVHDKPL